MKTKEPVLFYGVPQGCSFGSIVALEWLGEPYRLCRIDMLQRPWDPLYVRVNPLLKTPALLLEDGRTLSESLAILLHLASRHPESELGVSRSRADADALNQMLAYLVTDFFSAFSPLWAAYDREDLDEGQKKLLRALGREDVAQQCVYLDGLLRDREWLLGSRRSVADAYLSGLARWIGYHKLFDVERDYPHLARHLRKLAADPAVVFARHIEDGVAARSTGRFLGHVTLEELRPLLAA